MFLGGKFLFVPSDTFAVGCVVYPQKQYLLEREPLCIAHDTSNTIHNGTELILVPKTTDAELDHTYFW